MCGPERRASRIRPKNKTKQRASPPHCGGSRPYITAAENRVVRCLAHLSCKDYRGGVENHVVTR